MTYNFDRVSDQYDATRGFPPGVADQITDWVLARLPADPAIAEIGVGTGRIAIPFIKRGVRYTGFDISEQMTAQLREKLGGDLQRSRLVMADVTEALPLDEASQDAVLAVHILHLVDPIKALTQIRRVVKPGGALVWGFEWHDDAAPRTRIRHHMYTVVQGMGRMASRDFLAEDGRQLLASWGTKMTRHEVASWTKQESPRQVLQGLQERLWSATWSLPEDVLQEGVRQTTLWAEQEYGDLDRPLPVTNQFIVDWFEF